MGSRPKIALTLTVAGLVAVGAVGCGGGSSSASTGGSKAATGQPQGSAGFIVKGGKNKVAKFGEEADAAEREAASKVLAQNLKARETGDWAGQCASLTAAHVKAMKELASERKLEKGCAGGLASEAEPLEGTAALRADTLSGPIDAFRVEGVHGYALYHGDDGKNYAMAMKKEHGEWKVASLTTVELPKPKGG